MKDYIIKSKQKKHKNSLGSIVEKFGIGTLISCLIGGLVASSSAIGEGQLFTFLIWFLAGIISAVFHFAFAEILHLLESIKNQSYIITEYTEDEKLKDQEEQPLSDEEIEELLEEEITEE